jgi:hypothetical protein
LMNLFGIRKIHIIRNHRREIVFQIGNFLMVV